MDNKGGAGGNLGAAEAAKAPGDGHTLLMGALTAHSTMATLEKGKLKYDLLNDLKPVHIVGQVPLVFVVNPMVPVKDLMAETVPAAQPFIKSGKLRALAVTPHQRISMLPDVPTVKESVGWGDVDVVSTFGVLVPASTPNDIALRLNTELGKILQNPDVKEQLLQQGVYAAQPQSLQQASERLRAEVARWEKVIKETGIRSDD